MIHVIRILYTCQFVYRLALFPLRQRKHRIVLQRFVRLQRARAVSSRGDSVRVRIEVDGKSLRFPRMSTWPSKYRPGYMCPMSCGNLQGNDRICLLTVCGRQIRKSRWPNFRDRVQ